MVNDSEIANGDTVRSETTQALFTTDQQGVIIHVLYGDAINGADHEVLAHHV